MTASFYAGKEWKSFVRFMQSLKMLVISFADVPVRAKKWQTFFCGRKVGLKLSSPKISSKPETRIFT